MEFSITNYRPIASTVWKEKKWYWLIMITSHLFAITPFVHCWTISLMKYSPMTFTNDLKRWIHSVQWCRNWGNQTELKQPLIFYMQICCQMQLLAGTYVCMVLRLCASQLWLYNLMLLVSLGTRPSHACTQVYIWTRCRLNTGPECCWSTARHVGHWYRIARNFRMRGSGSETSC